MTAVQEVVVYIAFAYIFSISIGIWIYQILKNKK